MQLASPKQVAPADETLERLVTMVTQTNLAVLDKTLSAVKNAHTSYSYSIAAERCGSIAERIIRTANEVAMTLPVNLRVTQ